MPVKTKSLNIRKILYGAALLLAAGTQLGAVTALSSCTNPGPSQRGKAVTVHNMAGLQAAIAAARPGDQIVMADGTWTDAVIDFNAQATAAAPITLKARTPGKVILTGTSRLTFSRPYLVADGLHFKNGIPAQGNVIDFKTDHCRLTNAAVVDYNPLVPTQDYYWVYFNGSHNRVDHSYFKGKNNNQPLVGNAQDDSRYNQVDYCHFKDIPTAMSMAARSSASGATAAARNWVTTAVSLPSNTTYSVVATDIDGQPRTGKHDVGADEMGAGPGPRRPLTAKDVGPAWMR